MGIRSEAQAEHRSNLMMSAPGMMRPVCVFAVLSVVTCFPSLRFNLPNGARVPCPPGGTGCIPAQESDQPPMMCKGLGHRTCEGGTLPLNPFGEAFKAANFRWTAELCCADSDGDGQTNGEELGDPMCELVGKWEAEKASTLSDALRFYDVSHPGVGAHTSKNVSASIGSDACPTCA